MKTLSLNIQGDSKMPTVEFMIGINIMTLNDLPFFSTVEINGETELVYSSTIDFIGGLCLSIAPSSSNGTFRMTCGSTQKKEVATTEETTSTSGHITETMIEPTVSQTQTKPQHDANPYSKTTINLIGINGFSSCLDKVPVIHVCRQNDVNETTQMYVSTGCFPECTAIVCRCTIIPAGKKEFILNIQYAGNSLEAAYAFLFEIDNVTLLDFKDEFQVNITRETQLVYSSNVPNVGFCLQIESSTSDGKFSMTCVRNQKGEVTATEDTTSSRGYSTDATSTSGHSTDTTLSKGHSTDTSGEPTVSHTHQTKAPTDRETNINLIATISWSVGGVAFIAVIVIAIICCKRNRKPEITVASGPSEPENNDDYAYGMVPNPAYEHFSDVLSMKTIASEDEDTKADITNIDSSSHYYSTPIKTANNKAHIQRTHSDEGDTYDHTATSSSGYWIGNEYKRQPINRNENNCDNENYSVLNAK